MQSQEHFGLTFQGQVLSFDTGPGKLPNINVLLDDSSINTSAQKYLESSWLSKKQRESWIRKMDKQKRMHLVNVSLMSQGFKLYPRVTKL